MFNDKYFTIVSEDGIFEATISVFAWKIFQFVTVTDLGSQQPKGNKANLPTANQLVFFLKLQY